MSDAFKLFGFFPYVAERHARPGEDLWDKITENMADSNAILVLLTESGRKSHDVREEIGNAQMLRRLRPEAGFRIVPVVTNGGGMPGGSLAGREFVRIDDGEGGRGMDDLVSNVRHALGMADNGSCGARPCPPRGGGVPIPGARLHAAQGAVVDRRADHGGGGGESA